MDIHQRRSLLACQANPDGGRDYLSALSGSFASSGEENSGLYAFHICYVPDRYVLEPDGLSCYLAQMGRQQWSSVELIATTLLRDLQNEIIPRWVQVTVELKLPALEHLDQQVITVEDAQPGWQNDELLNRLGV